MKDNYLQQKNRKKKFNMARKLTDIEIHIKKVVDTTVVHIAEKFT